MRKFFYENGLTLVLVVITVGIMAGHSVTGQREFNQQQREHHQPEVTWTGYLQTGRYVESVFENWESEFFQMGWYVMLTIWLRQKGSADSKPVDGSEEEVDREPDPTKEDAPWPVKRGGWVLALYRRSLTIAFFTLFLICFGLHAWGAARSHNHEQALKGQPDHETMLSMLGTSEFWFQSLENWQSEFLSIAVLVVLSIFLRQHGSPESKPLDASFAETGE